MSKILQVEHLVQEFNLTKDFLDKVKFKKGRFSLENQVVHAVNDVSFDVEQGEVFSLVGESGCGKSTTARTVIKLIEPKAGKITFDGRDITRLKPQEMRPVRREMQMIFQDPYASLNPRQKVMEILTEPMLFHKLCTSKAEAEEKAVNLLERVGLSSEQANRYPHQFSGGQRQRIGIARALAVEPKFIIADEPVSALDVSIQAQILNILMDLKDEFHFSYLFIAHDLSVVKHISDSLGVMYLGSIVDDTLFTFSKHMTICIIRFLPIRKHLRHIHLLHRNRQLWVRHQQVVYIPIFHQNEQLLLMIANLFQVQVCRFVGAGSHYGFPRQCQNT